MKRLVIAMVGVLALFGAVSCGAPESCSQGGTCSKGGTWQACCTSTHCRYTTSDGSEFKCNGTDCASGSPSAAKQVADWCLAH